MTSTDVVEGAILVWSRRLPVEGDSLTVTVTRSFELELFRLSRPLLAVKRTGMLLRKTVRRRLPETQWSKKGRGRMTKRRPGLR